ncbi:MAG: hypothetical protein HOV79_06550 [Hamadaea sp.]|nr:hypothetical protein [Hamadaea sp.]
MERTSFSAFSAKLARRWPTALAVLSAVVILGGDTGLGMVQGLGEVIPLLALEYVLLAKIGRRGATWPVVVAGSAVLTAAQVIGVVSPVVVLFAIALAVLVWGAVDGQLRRPGALRVQAWGMLGFGALAVAGLALEPAAGRWLIAAGWLAHGVWDFVHLKRDAVVSRSYAEWCGVLDVLVATGLIVLTVF